MPMSNFPGGFAHGLSVRGMPLVMAHPGSVFWVDSVNGSNGNDGTYQRPFSTIDYAVGRCTASRGDIIFVKPGHSETITTATEIVLDVAGIALVGLGQGTTRPTISLNHANAKIPITGANTFVTGFRFLSDVTVVAIGLDIDATDVTIQGNSFEPVATGTDEFVITIDVGAGSHRCAIIDNDIDNGIGGAAVGIKLVGASNFVKIQKNRIWGDYSTACINGITTLSGNVLIEDNLLMNGIGGDLNSEPAIELLTGTTGVVRRNDIVCNLATKLASIVGDTLLLFENYYNEDITGTGGLIGAVSADD